MKMNGMQWHRDIIHNAKLTYTTFMHWTQSVSLISWLHLKKNLETVSRRFLTEFGEKFSTDAASLLS